MVQARRFLLDASSVVKLGLERPEALMAIREGLVLDLTLYEVGSAASGLVSKGKLDVEEARSLLINLTGLIIKNFKVLRGLSAEEAEEALSLALRLGLTFYDAVYVAFSKSYQACMVTEDRELRRAAQASGIEVLSADDLLSTVGSVKGG